MVVHILRSEASLFSSIDIEDLDSLTISSLSNQPLPSTSSSVVSHNQHETTPSAPPSQAGVCVCVSVCVCVWVMLLLSHRCW